MNNNIESVIPLHVLASSKHMMTAISTSSGTVAVGIAHDRVVTVDSSSIWCIIIYINNYVAVYVICLVITFT